MKLQRAFLTSVLGLALAAPAWAGDPFIIDVGQDFSGNERTTTGQIRTLAVSDSLATSFYFVETADEPVQPAGASIEPGTRVADTNIQSLMDSYGFQAGTFTAIDGTTEVEFRNPDPSQDRNVVNLNFLTGEGGIQGRNGFSSEDWFIDGEGWGLTYDYQIFGQVTNGGVFYDDGFVNVYYEDGDSGDRTQVLRMLVERSDLQLGNLDIFGRVVYEDFDFSEEFVQNFFRDVGTGKTFYELASEEEGLMIPVSWRFDGNIDPPLPTDDQLVAFESEDGTSVLVRQSEQDGTFRYEVPEPSVLLMMGSGLVLLGLALRVGRREDEEVAY
ncbi:PEP-CTERM sorting domain-containing protein [Halorhodospira halophila]|uniref:PEP-CTERM sorting domain-containing protein n=1 Tax=Halorhodospira halophila TaxID=1053 RepID=UPI001911EDEF|nr:hypothetical protein [Halorhodospira halophila]